MQAVKYLRWAGLYSCLTETTPRPLRPTLKTSPKVDKTKMATDFTQDTVLHFLQSSGGSVKNSDLLLHFRNFIRDHPDRDRNRELFKKYVNSVATVKQIDGISYVVLRRKFKGHVSGVGEAGSPGLPRLPAGKKIEPLPENAKLSPPGREKPRLTPQLRDVTVTAPLGVTAGKTILPAAGIIPNNNNNNVETIFNLKDQQQQVQTVEVSGGIATAQVVSHTTEKTEVKTPSLSPAQNQHNEVGLQRGRLGPPPGMTPVVAAVGYHGETSRQVPVTEPLRGREGCLQPEKGLYQEPPLHHISLDPQVAPRRFRYRQSYKSAVSHDEHEEEEKEVPMRRDMGRAISASSLCIIDRPVPPSVVSSSSSSPETKLPKIYIHDVKEEKLPNSTLGWSLESGMGQRGEWAGQGLKHGPVSGESTSSGCSPALEAECHMPSRDQVIELMPQSDILMDRRCQQTSGVQLQLRQGLEQNQRAWKESDCPMSGFLGGLGWNSSCEDLQTQAGKTGGGSKVQGVLQWAPRTKLESVMLHGNRKATVPWHHSTGNLLDDQEFAARVLPSHLSTGDLYDDCKEAESSEGSTSSPLRPVVARRLSRQLRNRMCHSMGADLDQLLQEEARGGGGGNEAARLNRLHMISSSLSLRFNLSSSSLSSCSTPPRCHSFSDLVEGVEGKGGSRSLSAASSPSGHHEAPSRQSLVPLEASEHAWLVKAAAGAWPDIYSLFREDSSLLNRRDFISGFTVLHWIAKHGDHRVLNTLWYGVQKAGLTFDINARSTCGHTPLHIAAIHSHKNIMRLLVSKFKADIRLRDTAGKKPWQYLSHTMPSDVFQLLGAPSRAASRKEGGVTRVDTILKPEKHQRRRRRHYLSSASGERPLTISGTTKVKRSSSIAAFLKHKSLYGFHGHQSDSSI